MQALVSEFKPSAKKIKLLNIGANTSVVVEQVLHQEGIDFMCDRIDVIDPTVPEHFSWLGKSVQASVETMPQISSDTYQGAFANFVFEHLEHPEQAAQEVARVLSPQGIFVCSIPNSQAPEFWLSHHTPQWFHQYVRGYSESAEAEAHHTHYHYSSVRELIKIFESAGLKLEKSWYDPATYVYLHRFPIIKYVSKAYDWLIEKLGWKRLLGAVCLVFRKS